MVDKEFLDLSSSRIEDFVYINDQPYEP